MKYQMKLHADDLKEGDVLMVNSPNAGGSCVLHCVLDASR